ncbi:DUF167 domain-containing protein [Legionella dresdenensis]|uniref:UPF0235 protein ACFORL_10285 n=1 Tax=Legionella dresdenensis TaxID=450200 RepID=A0ABV8CGN3_9GAMM
MWYQHDKELITLQVYVQPGAKTTEITGLYDGLLKIRLNAPPVEGRANETLQQYIARLFAVPVRQVTLVRGISSRRKTLKIQGSTIDPETLLVGL